MPDGGQPLPPTLRNFFEPRLDVELGDVRLHDDAGAAATARSLKARALTVGQDIYFASGAYAPDTQRGLQLLGHELAHVAQQELSPGPVAPPALLQADGRAALESEATQAGRALTQGEPFQVRLHAPTVPLLEGEWTETPAPYQPRVRLHQVSSRRIQILVDDDVVAEVQLPEGDYKLQVSDSWDAGARRLNITVETTAGVELAVYEGLPEAIQIREVPFVERSPQVPAPAPQREPTKTRQTTPRTPAPLAPQVPQPATPIPQAPQPSAPTLTPEDIRAIVDRIIAALKGVTTASDSEAILGEFQDRDATAVRAILEELKRRASAHDETPEGMIRWLLKDLTQEDRRTLQKLLSQLGVTEDLSPVLAEEVEELLSGITTGSASQEVLSVLRLLRGNGLDQALAALETKTGLGQEELADWLFGDLSREDAERARRHFFEHGGPRAVGYATHFTVSKLESLLSVYTGHADSGSIAWNLEHTPERHRASVLSALDARTRTRWRQSAEDALMEDMDRSDYERIQKLPGLTLRPYDYQQSVLEKALSVAEWGEIVAEVLAGGAVGVVTGVISVLWDFVELAWDVVVAAKHLVMSFFYLVSGGVVGSSDWLAVKDFFRGFAHLFEDPMAILHAAWEEAKLGSETIEGAFEYGRRAEYWTRKVINFVVNVVLIIKGAAKGGQKLAQTVRRMRLVRNVEGAADLLERVKDLGKVERLLDKVKDAERLQRMLDAVGGDAGKLQAILDKLKKAEDVERLEQILGRVGPGGSGRGIGNLPSLMETVPDLAELEKLLSRFGNNATRLDTLLNAVGKDLKRLETLLLYAGGDHQRLERLFQGVRYDGTKLEKLIAVVKDAERLERFFVAVQNDARMLERLLTELPNELELERLMALAGRGHAPGEAGYMLDRVLEQMPAGTKAIPDIEAAVHRQKVFDNKVLYAEQKTPHAPGTTPAGAARDIRGGHSPRLLTDPEFRVSTQTTNADGTVSAKFQKVLQAASPGPPPVAEVLSKPKTSTLAPPRWTDADILRAGDTVARKPPVLGPRASDGATLHRDIVNGVQWEVIKDSSGRVISSYPTGGTPSTSF